MHLHLGDTAASTPAQIALPNPNAVGTWDRIGSSGGQGCFNVVSGLQVPCWCLALPWMDACNPIASMPPSVTVNPVAPQTQNQMTNPGAWTLDEALTWTNYVQSQVNAAQDTARANSLDAAAAGNPPASPTGSTGWYILAGAAALVAVLVIAKK